MIKSMRFAMLIAIILSSGSLIGSDKPTKKESKQKSERFSCDGKDKCKQMSTCAEAKFYLNECGIRKLDKDKDGTPCESLCN